MEVEATLVAASSLFVREAASTAIRATIEQRIKSQKTRTRNVPTIEVQVDKALESLDESVFSMRLQEVAGWASEIHVQGMPSPVETHTSSVALDFTTVARRFRLGDGRAPTLDEDALAQGQASYLLLGDPGSGKTTTLKRLALALLQPGPGTAGSVPRMPVIIVCRQVDWDSTTIATEILCRFGFDVARIKADLELSATLLPQFVAQLLNETSSFVFVDGLDEIPDQNQRRSVLNDLERLRHILRGARIICSCRSGDAPHAQGFSTAELLPLSRKQMEAIVEARTGNAKAFFRRVQEAGIRDDVLDRPLFLSQLLIVYETSGVLPERPVDLYRQLLRLLLHDWDEQRRVVRRSHYAEFDGETKKEFLAEIAFRLTVGRSAVFSDSTLLEIYKEIHLSYSLPALQARDVVREIESHTGIMVEVGNGYQFVHYTMQEYLCADNISRRPIDPEVASYLDSYPAVVAVAVALSSKPTQWLKECVKLRRTSSPTSFVSRLGLERPRFSAELALAELLVKMMQNSRPDDAPHWERLSQIQAVRDSFVMLHERFDIARLARRVTLMRHRESNRNRESQAAFANLPQPVFDLFLEA